MFNRGISELLRNLPSFEGLDGALARRWLSAAYVETLDLRVGSSADSGALSRNLGRLSTALQLHAILVPNVEPEMRQACAFVAAEALSLIDQLVPDDEEADLPLQLGRGRYRRLESGLLYLIAGFDSNAAVMASGVAVREPFLEASASERRVHAALEGAVAALCGILLLRPRQIFELPEPDPDAPLEHLLRADLWHRLGSAADAHLRWLRLEDRGETSSATSALDELLRPLLDEQAGAYGEIAHLGRLLRQVAAETSARALRAVSAPAPPGAWEEYRTARSRERPLLWPAAAQYAERCLPGPREHAAVAVPTGAGKSGVAELAIAQAISHGWVLYLAPTNALVAQVQRDLRRALRSMPDAEVRGFIGGAELVTVTEEAVGDVASNQVLVMTPEKCSLALRQAPDAFANLALCVLDECHLIADRGTRGVLAELVIAHVLFAAPTVRVLLLSALMANPEELAGWLQTVTGQGAVPIREPWRPTRTLRAVLGFDTQRAEDAAEEAVSFLEANPKRKTRSFEPPPVLVAGLQGAWESDDRHDYTLIPVDVPIRLEVRRDASGVHVEGGYVNGAVAAIAGRLARSGHRVLAFLPRSRHYSFSVGATVDLRDAGLAQISPEVDAQIALANAELGLSSALSDLLQRGVAVHTSAMLPFERRASELAFEQGSARIMFATGTLAQGLNLPATAVVIGGTEIGHDPTLTQTQREERTQAQLLNAIGRSGRPGVAARSMAIVVPDRANFISPGTFVNPVRSSAPFLANEDAAAPVTSRLDVLVDRALREDVDVEGMTVEELAAFAVLPLENEGAQSGEIVRRSYGAWRRNAATQASAQVIARSLVGLGGRFLGERPRWLAQAAYSAGLTVHQTLALHDAYLAVRPNETPTEPEQWVRVALTAAARMPAGQLSGIVDASAVASTRLAGVHEPSPTDRASAWGALNDAVTAWMTGETYEQLAILTIGPSAAGRTERHQRAPLPRVIRVIDEVFVFGLSRLVGGVFALHQEGATADADTWGLTDNQKAALGVAPIAIRSGCGPLSALAWYRFAVRHRRLAHLLGRRFPPPEDADEATVRSAVRGSYEQWLEESEEDALGVSDLDRAALQAWRALNVRPT